MQPRYFTTARVAGSAPLPPPDDRTVDVAVLDMNHDWPNVGHDAIVRAVQHAAELLEPLLGDAIAVRTLSFDIRKSQQIPAARDDRFQIFIGTGGPGHLDPRLNDGVSEESQGITEESSWEAPLFELFDAVHRDPRRALIGVCHTFGLLCRWSGIARPALRGPEKNGKSSGVIRNVLTAAAKDHPYFSRFAESLDDGTHFSVIDSRFFDLLPARSDDSGAMALEGEHNPEPRALTMQDYAPTAAGDVPRFFAANHHPEIYDRDELLEILNEKYSRGEVTEKWFRERADTLGNDWTGATAEAIRLTSNFTFLYPLQFHLRRLVVARREALGLPPISLELPIDQIMGAAKK